MNNFENAFDLMKTNIERKVADFEIAQKIVLTDLTPKEYQLLVDFLTDEFCNTGNYAVLRPDSINKYITAIKSDPYDTIKNLPRRNELVLQAKKVRQQLFTSISLAKQSDKPDSFRAYNAILRRKYKWLCAEIKDLEFGVKP